MHLLGKRWAQVLILMLLLVAAVLLRLQDPPAIERMRQLTFDYYNKLLPRKASDDVLIIDIDEASIEKYGQWPWPRTQIAEIPAILKEMGATAVVFDVVFSEPDRTSPALIASSLPDNMADIAAALRQVPDNDTLFAEKIKETGIVVTGFTAANQKTNHILTAKAKFINEGHKPDTGKFVRTSQDFTATLPQLSNAAAGNGSFTMFPESDGIIRRVPLIIGEKTPEGKVTGIYPSLSLEALRIANNKFIYKVKSYGESHQQGYGITSIQVGNYTIPTDKTGSVWVYYTGHRKNIYVPAWQVLTRELSPERVKGKIVFIGTSAIGLLDLRSSPLNAVLPGVEIHAEITEQILHGQFLNRPDFLNGAELIFAVIISLFIIFVSPFINTGVLAIVCCILIGGSCFGGFYAYGTYGLVLDPVYPSLAILTVFIVSSVLTNLRSEIEKHHVRQAFSQYLSPVLIKELANNPEKLKLGGEVREISVMFMDIRNFATICEGMDPADMIKLMSEFLTPMTSCVLDNRGTVDKYIGDAMMSFWNAPLDDPHHAQNACTSALLMVKALDPVNKHMQEDSEKTGKPYRPLRAGIGVHTGNASVGNMGSKQRFAYSALGDAVNLSSRLEGQTKAYAVSIIVSESTYKQASNFAAIEIDILVVKGRKGEERIYTLLGTPEQAAHADFQSFKQLHDTMLSAYRAQDWQKALDLCAKCRAMREDLSGLYKIYEERIAQYKQTPPEQGWRGVWIATSK